MTQVKFTVEHPGNHEPDATQIGRALAAELKARGLKRVGDGYKVRASRVTSGVDSDLTVEVDTEQGQAPKQRATRKAAASKPAAEPSETVTEVVAGTNEPVTPSEV